MAIARPVKVRHSRMFLAVVRLGSPQAGSELDPAIKAFGGDNYFGDNLSAEAVDMPKPAASHFIHWQ
jgi:hypothetical protein